MKSTEILESINNYPFHYSEQEIKDNTDIIERWQLEIDPVKRKQLGNEVLNISYDRIKKFVICTLANGQFYRQDLIEDALQEACLLYMQMMMSYDSKKNNDPFLYTRKSIQRHILSKLQCIDYGYSDHEWELIYNIKNKKKFMSSSSTEEIAKQLHISENVVIAYDEIQQKIVHKKSVEDLSEYTLNSVKAKEKSLHDKTIGKISHAAVCEALKEYLTNDELYVISKLFGFDDDQLYSISDLANHFKISVTSMYNRYYRLLRKIQSNKNIIDLLREVES